MNKEQFLLKTKTNQSTFSNEKSQEFLTKLTKFINKEKQLNQTLEDLKPYLQGNRRKMRFIWKSAETIIGKTKKPK